MTNFRTPLPNGFQNLTKDSAPRLMLLLNLDNLVDLPSSSVLHAGTEEEVYARLRADGFEGIQITHGDPLPKSPALPFCGLSRINVPSDADIVAARHADRGDRCITVHLGLGIEDDREVDALVEAVLEAQQRRRIAIFIETHRATVTQDIWRTVQLIKRHPDVRFNGDFSHYYCGQELVYGDWNQKLHFLTPLFDRVGFIHGRIASPGCIQVPISEDLHTRPVQAHGLVNYLDHFRELWTRAMLGFLRNAAPGAVLPLLLSFSPGHITTRDCFRTRKELCVKNQTGMPRLCCLHKSRVRVSLPHRNGRKMPITRRTSNFAALAVAATEARLATLRAQPKEFAKCHNV